MTYDAVMDMPVTRRKRLLAWIKVSSERSRKAANGDNLPSELSPIELLAVWGSRAERFVPENLRRKETPKPEE